MARDLEWFNSIQNDEAFKEFLSCCGSERWASQMVKCRLFGNAEQLKGHARDVWWKLDAADWLEAFRSHPKIGEWKAEASASQKAQQWSGQSNRVCTTHLDKRSIRSRESNQKARSKVWLYLHSVRHRQVVGGNVGNPRQRLTNEPDDELRIAANEQVKITELRLKKMLHL